jgi:hypothetical protein
MQWIRGRYAVDTRWLYTVYAVVMYAVVVYAVVVIYMGRSLVFLHVIVSR